MHVELATLTGPDYKFAHEYQLGELVPNEERVRLVEPLKISGRIVGAGRRVKVPGRITGGVNVECDRCLKAIHFPVDTQFALEYITPAEYEALPAAELKAEDLAVSVFDGELLDIDEVVREQLLLAIPSRLLCKEDCKGFCSGCGVDRNLVDCSCETSHIDPRWTVLKNLRL